MPHDKHDGHDGGMPSGCAHRRPTMITIRPLTGQFKFKELWVPADPDDLVLVGYGHKLRLHLDAPWVPELEDLLHTGVVFGYLRSRGVVAIATPSLKALATRLGADFLRVEQGIFISLLRCIMPNARQRLCGIDAGRVGGETLVLYVRCSKRGAHRLHCCTVAGGDLAG